MNKLVWIIATFYLLSCLHDAGVTAASRMRLNAQFRYEDVLIALKREASEDFFTPANISRLVEYISRFSSLMATATEAINRRISVHVFRVLVPASKVAALKAANFTFVPATWEPAADPDIWLKDSGDTKTIPASVCSGNNEFIELPTSYIKDIRWQRSVFHLLREFTKFRWGALSEEVGTNKFNSDFIPLICSATGGKYKTTTSPAIEFNSTVDCLNYIHDVLGITPTVDWFERNFDFEPYVTSTDKMASIMSREVGLFCENTTENQRGHNKQIDNLQNNWCSFKSVAEVLWEHADFSRSAVGTATGETAPTVLLVEPNGTRQVVLVLDVSTSMLGNRIRNLIRAASLYVEFFVETGAEVAIVTFNEAARVIQPMMKIANDTDRQTLANKIKGLVALGATNIADGITLAMEQLNARKPYVKTQTGFVILITDGLHNIGPSLNDAISNASLTSIVFDVVCISAAADVRMNSLAKSTGGLSMFSAENAPLSNEMEVAFTRLAERYANSTSKPVMLRSAIVTLPIQSQIVHIDGSVTKSLRFMLHLPNVPGGLSSINYTVQSPNGTVYGIDMGSAVYKADAAISTIIITIPDSDIKAGNWTMNAHQNSATGRRKRRDVEFLKRNRRSTSSGSITVVGVTDPSSSLNINMHAFLQLSSIPQVTVTSVQRIFAYVTNSTGPLLNAVIEASVSPASAGAFIVSLKDDGLGYDLTANDGIYVGVVYPNRMTSIGDYGVTVVMTSPIGRVTSAGKFRVDSLATGPVVMPPGRITDLAVVSSVKNQSVLISFTSPGNQAYEGLPTSYEIRASNSFDQISTSFGSASLVATLPGQAVGAKIQLLVWAANFTGVNTNTTFYMAASAISTGGVRGEASFPNSAMLAYPNGWVPAPTTTYATRAATPPTLPTAVAHAPTTSEPPRASNGTTGGDNWSPGVVAGVTVLTIALVAEVIAFVVVAVVVH